MNHSVRSSKIAASRVVSVADISPPPRPKHGDRFGRWRLDLKCRWLKLMDGDRELYSIDLDRCHDAASILDWALQVGLKTWARPDDVGSFLQALNALASYGLQGFVCPFGQPGEGINYSHILRDRAQIRRGTDHDGT